MKKFNGWQRLYIVLSAAYYLWLVTVIIYEWDWLEAHDATPLLILFLLIPIILYPTIRFLIFITKWVMAGFKNR